MKMSDILTLARAGFTAEQITNLASVSPDEAQAARVPAPVQAARVPAPVQTGDTGNFEKLIAALNTNTQAIQNFNLSHAAMPGRGQESAESIIASIINPTTGKEN